MQGGLVRRKLRFRRPNVGLHTGIAILENHLVEVSVSTQPIHVN